MDDGTYPETVLRLNKPFMESPSMNGQIVRLGAMQKNMIRMKGKEDRILHEIKVNRLK